MTRLQLTSVGVGGRSVGIVRISVLLLANLSRRALVPSACASTRMSNCGIGKRRFCAARFIIVTWRL